MIASTSVAPAPFADLTPAGSPVPAAAPAWAALGWRLALLGQFVLVFAIVALSGRGASTSWTARHATRWRSLVDHGDAKIRDARVWFMVFPGRDGEQYTIYRLPQSVLAPPRSPWRMRPDRSANPADTSSSY